MKTNKLFETESQRRKNRLLNILECINAAIIADKLFTIYTPGAKHENYCSLYDKEHAEALVKKLCEDLGLRGNGEKIYITDENSSFSFLITNTPVILADLKKELSIDWNKTYYPIVDFNTMDRKLTPKFPNIQPRFRFDQEESDCQANLQTAINGLQMLKTNNPGEKAKIKGLDNMVKLWEKHLGIENKALQPA